VQTDQEIIFVAQEEAGKVYKFDADLQKSSKEFDYLSGKYEMRLTVGDAIIQNPFVWHIADLRLKFSAPPTPEKVTEPTENYKKLPEIKHLFREPEKRPPQIVSDTFTVLCLVPVLILFILWLKIGVNISNFPLSLSALGFHLGLAGVFGLYTLFWLRMDMFTTLKYLAGIGGFMMLCENSMLRAMASKRKPKTE